MILRVPYVVEGTLIGVWGPSKFACEIFFGFKYYVIIVFWEFIIEKNDFIIASTGSKLKAHYLSFGRALRSSFCFLLYILPNHRLTSNPVFLAQLFKIRISLISAYLLPVRII